jgi:hypothetical protein
MGFPMNFRDIVSRHPSCIDCGDKTEFVFASDCVPPNTIAPVCAKCRKERFDYFKEHGAPKTTGNEVELCVVCGKETSYRLGTNVDLRENYVEGVGQCCEECSKK